MSQAVLTVDNLSKRFWIGERQDRGARYLVDRAIRDPLSIFREPKRKEFWALQDLNFSLHEGQKLAVIGRNGAGKSTLLKLISRITLPTKGSITLRGRVGSLLEVGTGFHPELTGRENIFLNGSLLGMRRAEIIKNFDDIVEFSEISEFIDTPVKRYSSGMYVRLAFAIAAHLQTELLIVDEVLAVGDQRFQKKCLEKMNEVGRAGRTILFVSHNLPLLQTVCSHGLLLEGGRQIAHGPLSNVLETYDQCNRAVGEQSAEGLVLDKIPRGAGMSNIFHTLLLHNDKGPISTLRLDASQSAALEMTLRLPPSIRKHLIISAKLSRPATGPVFALSSWAEKAALESASDNFKVRCGFILPPLQAGSYQLSLELHADGKLVDELSSFAEIEIEPHNFLGSGRHPAAADGALLVKSSWEIIS